MHETLNLIEKELTQVIAALNSVIPNDEPFSVAHGNWSFPSVSRKDLIMMTESVIDLIKTSGKDDLGSNSVLLSDYPRRLAYMRTATIQNMWANAGAGVPAFTATLQFLREALKTALHDQPAVEASKGLKNIMRRLRALESELTSAEPRTTALADMLKRIELAHEAADQLPTDLQSLSEARSRVAQLTTASAEDRATVGLMLKEAEACKDSLDSMEGEAKKIVEKCDDAYRTTSSQGLAAAFTERASSLNISMWVWVVGLVAALGLGVYLGSQQLANLSRIISNPESDKSLVWLNLLLSAFSVGAPIWFGWLSTKQIGQRFKMAEDYAFKASISKAYEGYRREAVNIDLAMQERLFSSALTRLDELPLRLVDDKTHGSPWHELADSTLLKKALDTVPGFAAKLTEFSAKQLDAVTKTKKATNKEEADN